MSIEVHKQSQVAWFRNEMVRKIRHWTVKKTHRFRTFPFRRRSVSTSYPLENNGRLWLTFGDQEKFSLNDILNSLLQ